MRGNRTATAVLRPPTGFEDGTGPPGAARQKADGGGTHPPRPSYGRKPVLKTGRATRPTHSKCMLILIHRLTVAAGGGAGGGPPPREAPARGGRGRGRGGRGR